jgi:hypothetical protein
LARGILHGGPADSVIRTAWCHLLVFAVIGYVVGRIAQGVVDDAVRGRIAAELAAEQQQTKKATPAG